FGGEPLLEFELIKKLVRYAEQKATYYGKEIHFSATTNCVLVNDEVIRFFRQHKIGFHTSIDGGSESHDKHRPFPDGRGTLAIIEPKIKKILKYRPETAARMTVCNDTVHRWFDDVLYLVKLGYKNLPMIPAAENDWTEEQWGFVQRELRKISDFYIERLRVGNPIYIKHINDILRSITNPSRRTYHCGAGRGYLSVKTDGAIYPCSRFGDSSDNSLRDQWYLGSVFDGIDHKKRKVFLNFNCASQTKADCENCLAANTCSISCIALNWSCFKDIYKPHPNSCRFKKLCFIEAVRIHYILESEKNPLFIKKFYSKRKQSRNTVHNVDGTQSQQYGT
ncbi:MAG: SPASM domain-containing protein, partial [bacterium]